MTIKVEILPRAISSQKVWEKLKPGRDEELLLLDLGRESKLDPNVYNQSEGPVSCLDLVNRIDFDTSRSGWDYVLVTHKEFHPEQVLAATTIFEEGHVHFERAEHTEDLAAVIKFANSEITKPDMRLRWICSIVSRLACLGWDGSRPLEYYHVPEVLEALDAESSAKKLFQVFEMGAGFRYTLADPEELEEAFSSPGFGRAFNVIVTSGVAGVRVYPHKKMGEDFLKFVEEFAEKNGWSVSGSTLQSPGVEPESEIDLFYTTFKKE